MTKHSIIILLLTLALISCEDQEFQDLKTVNSEMKLDEVKNTFELKYNKNVFNSIKNDPIWNDAKGINFNGQFYIEVPFKRLNLDDIKQSSSISLDILLASLNNNNEVQFNIVHLFSKDIDNVNIFQNESSLDNLENFNGFLTIFDLFKNIIKVDKYNNGQISLKKYEFIENTDIRKSMPYDEENCEVVVENIYTRWCWFWMDSDGNPIEVINCSGWTLDSSNSYKSCDGQAGGSTTDSRITEDELVEVLDSLTGRSKCVYKKVKDKNGNLFKKTIGKFIEDPEYKLVLKNGNCTTSQTACTDPKQLGSGIISIIIEDNFSPPLEMAATILHEGIHAEIFRYVDRFEKGLDPNNRKKLFELYKYYTGLDSTWGTTHAQHQYMVEFYVTPIAEAMRELDNNKYTLDYYMAYGWEGLESYGYHGTLTKEQMSEFVRKKVVVNNNTIFKGC